MMTKHFFAWVLIGGLALGAPAWARGKQPATRPAAKAAAKEPPLRQITVAVFDMDVNKEVEVNVGALTDRVNVMLAAMKNVTIVNRGQIKKVAEEHKMNLAGLVDSASAATLGKFLMAQYVVVGRASRIGGSLYLTLKVIDVQTTVQTTVSVKSSAERGAEGLVEKLSGTLEPQIVQLQQPVEPQEDAAMKKLREAAAKLKDKVFMVEVSETHINRPLRDPAAQMAITNRLRSAGLDVIVLKDPPEDWKKTLMQNGKYEDQKVDYLIEGEGVSAFAAEIQGLTSCRARVELRVILLPGRKIVHNDRGVASAVDMIEALAAKTALEEAGVNAVDAVVARMAEAVDKHQPERKQ